MDGPGSGEGGLIRPNSSHRADIQHSTSAPFRLKLGPTPAVQHGCCPAAYDAGRGRPAALRRRGGCSLGRSRSLQADARDQTSCGRTHAAAAAAARVLWSACGRAAAREPVAGGADEAAQRTSRRSRPALPHLSRRRSRRDARQRCWCGCGGRTADAVGRYDLAAARLRVRHAARCRRRQARHAMRLGGQAAQHGGCGLRRRTRSHRHRPGEPLLRSAWRCACAFLPDARRASCAGHFRPGHACAHGARAAAQRVCCSRHGHCACTLVSQRQGGHRQRGSGG